MEDNNISANQYFTFMLNKEIYGININRIREVLEFSQITKVPKTPKYMKGVINLRGGVVPVIDIKSKFNMGDTEKTIETCIIILEIEIEDETTMIGALADSVQEVIDIEDDEIEPAPKIGTSINTDFIKGMGKKNDQFIILLDTDQVFSSDELSVIEETTSKKKENTKETKVK